MYMFPLPFLTASLLIVFLAYSVLVRKHQLPPFTLLVLLGYALQATLIGIRWGFNHMPPLPIVGLASVLPLLTWAALNETVGNLHQKTKRLVLCAALAIVIAVTVLDILRLSTILDLLGTAQYVVFGVLLIAQALRAERGLLTFRSDRLPVTPELAFLLCGTLLLGSAAVDMAIATQTAFDKGRIASVLVGYTNFFVALITSSIFFFGGLLEDADHAPTAQRDARSTSAKPLDDTLDDSAEILNRLDVLMRQHHVYRSENLTLDCIASRIGAPARQISRVVRIASGMGVPQYVNSFRISDARQLLKDTGLPITEIVFAVGFTTKSSFNREFLRINGVSPSTWRARHRGNAQERDDMPEVLKTSAGNVPSDEMLFT